MFPTAPKLAYNAARIAKFQQVTTRIGTFTAVTRVPNPTGDAKIPKQFRDIAILLYGPIVSDGKGTIYINISNKANVTVVVAKKLKVIAHYDCSSRGQGGSGLALDAKNHILFACYRQPSPVVVVLNARTGNIIITLPTGMGVDTVTFDPATKRRSVPNSPAPRKKIPPSSRSNRLLKQLRGPRRLLSTPRRITCSRWPPNSVRPSPVRADSRGVRHAAS